ncbi:SH3 domain-containing protein [Peribacillus asahii]|uniref:SH3 domain-containing protein n=1 Tax=Peribacillus asahii TaxID=228899 RepID=UPI00380FB728
MKRLFKLIIMLVFVFSFFSFNSSTTEAATAKIAYVDISSGSLNVRNGAGTNYKKVGSLKKDTEVYVYSETKSGWSEIRYNNKKAYVSTEYLNFVVSYLRDKSKIYTYRSTSGQKNKAKLSSEKTYKKIYTGEGHDGGYEWVSNHGIDIIEEDSSGLYQGGSDGFYFAQIAYPVIVGKSWIASENKEIATILSVNKTIKTSAGTFKNVVEVKYEYDNGYYYTAYFAKNVGLIKSVSKDETYYELVSLKKR